MEALLIYLAKASAILGIFYLVYIFFLKEETFFETNRWYFIFGIVAAFSIPFITLTKTVYIKAPTTTINTANIPEALMENGMLSVATETPEFTINWLYVFGILYAIGLVIMFVKLIIQLLSVYRIISKNKITTSNGIKYVETKEQHTPFSFFNYVVYNPELFSKEELDVILKHENAHSEERHSIDVLLSKTVQIIQWLNPFAWWYHKAITQNLEYLADLKATEHMTCRKSYQLTLLKATQYNQLSITTNFFNSLIKKRIIMLQQQKSKKTNVLKLALVLPALVAFVFIFNTEEVVAYEATNTTTVNTLPVVEEIAKRIEISIDKNTTKADLEKIKKQLKKEGIDFKYRKVKFNDNNELTSISITVKDNNGNTGSYALSSDGEPITPFTFTANDGTFAFTGNKRHRNHDYIVMRDKERAHHDKIMKKHKKKMKEHKIKMKAHAERMKDHDKNVWITDDGKKVHVSKSKVMVISDDEDGEVHEIEIDTDDDHDGVIIINGEKMDLGEMEIDLDDLMEGQNFSINIDIDEDGEKMFFNGKEMDMEKIKEKAEKMAQRMEKRSEKLVLRSKELEDRARAMQERIEKRMVFREKNENGEIKERVYKFDNDDDAMVFFGEGEQKRFQFVDDPNIKKVIIIDGKEADFKTLDQLAKDGKLDSVDILKSKTAISIYGKKAKDGAIIATTKK